MKKIYLVLFVILSIFVFSCKDNLISDDLSSSQNSGVGQVKVFVKQSRLIGPELSDVSWDVLLQKDNENDTISGKNINGYYLFSGLESGTYNITVSGKIDDVEKFTGSAKVILQQGQNLDVNVPVVASKPNNDTTTSTGFATITMDMSDELLSLLNSMVPDVSFAVQLYSVDGNDNDNEYITASLVETSTDEQGEIVSIVDNQKVKFVNKTSPTESYEIPTGYYYLTFSGLGQYGYTIKLKDNLVEIGDGLTTNIVLTQDDYELVYNSEYTYYVNNTGNENNTGLTLSSPIAYTSLPENIGVVFLLEDVEGPSTSLNNYDLISSFGSKIFTITNPVRNGASFSPSLKNIKIAGDYSINLNSSIYDTVILDIPVVSSENGDSCVYVSKSSNLRIGQNFSGELGICLSSGNWQLGDTVVTFENGKPEDCNLFIFDDPDLGTDFASKFYIDDKGKLAQYDATSQWVNFAWNDVEPCLITQTQAKNKTYTSIYDSTYGYLDGFNGISTYDEESQTWYFIANGSDASVNTVPSLYRVSAPTEYTDIVTPEKLCEVKLDETGQISINVQDIYIYDDKIYLCNLSSYDTYEVYEVYESHLNDIDFDWNLLHYTGDTVTALLVKNDVIYIATTTSVDNFGVTHSEIWRYKWDSDLDYTTAVDTYNQDGKIIPVPYYQTSSDIFEGEIDGSTFRITDLYSSEDGSIYGLLANYIEKEGANSVGSNDKNKSFMRGSVFKLEQNTSRPKNSSEPMMNANHFGLRNSFPLTTSELPTAKQYFILPRKIVGILNKKLVIVDDGMVPDSNDCNVDRFALFDLFNLADEISETIDVAVTFSTNGVANTSESRFYTSNSLFN